MATKKTAKKTAKKADGNKPMNKSQLLDAVVESTELKRKEVNAVLESLNDIIATQIGKRGPGVFMLPGMLKIKVVVKPARKARKGINPFTGEEMVFKARPARKVAKILPLKKIKGML
jgi:nucleoid DNA-binding protein